MAATVPWRRTFMIFWIGQFVALTGLALAMFSLGVYVYRLSDSPTTLGIAFAVPIIPFIVASPIGGVLVDRWGPKRALLVSNALGLGNVLVVALFHAIGTFEAGRVLLFLWAAAAIKAMHLAAFEAATVFLVPKRSLARANGLRMFLTGAGALVGPVVSIPLLDAANVLGVILIGSLSFALSLVTLGLVRIPDIQRDRVGASAGTSFAGEFRDAWRYITARPGLVAVMACLIAISAATGSAELLTTQLTLSFTTEEALSVVLLSGAFGLAVGTVAMLVWGGPKRLSSGLFSFSMLFAGAMLVSGLRPNVLLLSVAAFLFMGSTPILIGTVKTLWQLKVRPELLGRTAALSNLLVDVPYMLANILMGFAAGLAFVPLVGEDEVRVPVLEALLGAGPGRGYALQMMVVGLVVATCVILAYRSPRMRNVEEELPDVTPEDVEAGVETTPEVVKPAVR
ncbi:MFS transporter [Phytohabitans kaempferiae]|uniref:MFS transporter n=1 Tax=Phytohabitans kaempferiae TaxID=1620943 RepID=A0ABV6LZ52_9ACTN